MPNCLDCKNISRTKGGTELAKMGFVGCTQKRAGMTRSISSDASCKHFFPGVPEAVEKNRAWAKKLELR